MKKLIIIFFGITFSVFAFATTGPIYSNDLNGAVNDRNGNAASATRFSGPDKLVVTSDQINDAEGTIVFWVKPNYRFHDEPTHTFVHSLLNTPASSASDFVFADGFWAWASNDPKWYNDGSNFLYFVHETSVGGVFPVRTDEVNTLIEKDRDPLENTWKMVALTWKTGAVGNLSVYVNGRIPENEKRLQSIGNYSFAGFQRDGAGNATIYIGNNSAGTNSSVSDFDDLKIYDRSLSATEINDLFVNSFSTAAAAADFRDRQWLYPELSNAYNPKRDKYNKIIENRVIFDETAMYLSQGVDAVVSKIEAAHMNIYVPNVWHGRGIRWKPSATSGTGVEPAYDSKVDCTVSSILCHVDAAVANQSSDKLADLIQAAHAKGIQVQPWFTIAKYDWPYVGVSNYQLNWTYLTGTERAYDLEKPEFRQYIRDQIIDVVSRYDIDGINLDYIRFVGDVPGTAAQIETENARRKPIVMDFLTYLVKEIRDVKRNLPITIDGSPVSELDHRFKRIDDPYGRNQLLWMENDLIDAAFDMDYQKIVNTSKFDFASKHYLPSLSSPKSPNAAIKLLGNYEPGDPPTSRDSSTLKDLVRFSQNRWPGSVAIYWLDEFFRTPAQVTALADANGPFAESSRPLWKFNGPQLNISLSKAADQILTIDNVTLDADAVDLEDGDRSSFVAWSLDGVGFFTGDSVVKKFSAGNHVLTATVSNSHGQTDSVSKNIVVTDGDADGDGVLDSVDNCPLVANSTQTDINSNGIGDACEHGLTAKYYNSTTPGGTAVLTRIDGNVDFNWGFASPGGGVNTDYFSARWTGRLLVPAYTGTYHFCIMGDDGIRLWVNNAQILNFWVPQDSVKNCADIALTAGQSVPIKVEFFDALEEAIVQMTWSYPGQSEVVVPSSQLYAQ